MICNNCGKRIKKIDKYRCPFCNANNEPVSKDGICVEVFKRYY